MGDPVEDESMPLGMFEGPMGKPGLASGVSSIKWSETLTRGEDRGDDVTTNDVEVSILVLVLECVLTTEEYSDI